MDKFYLNKTYNNGQYKDHPVPIYLDNNGRPYDDYGPLYQDSWTNIKADARTKITKYKKQAGESWKNEVVEEVHSILRFIKHLID